MKTDRKQELKRQIKEVDKQEKETLKNIRSSEEYKRLDKKEKYLEKKSEKLISEVEEIKEKVYLIYLSDENSPNYTNVDNDWTTKKRNIRKETLNGIKRGLGITNLSSLKATEIEEVVQKLIDTKLNNDGEYQRKKEENEKIEDEVEKIEGINDKLIDEVEDEFWEKRSEFDEKLNEIELEEETIKDLKNPKKMNKAKKIQKRKEARKKLVNVNNKLDKIHNEIIKERIVTNLEEENGE